MESVNRLCVVSHVIHYTYEGQLYAYGPYAREIDIWADMFPEVIIAAPCRDELPPKFCMPFTRSNISIRTQIQSGGDTIKDKILQIAVLPKHVWNLTRVMRDADAIHVRCPGNIGLFGIVLAPLYSKNLIAKYAGQWNDYADEPFSFRLQKRLLKSFWWRGPVTVYGEWLNQPPNIIPFFTSMMTKQQIEKAIICAEKKRISNPLQVVFSGRLVKEKGVAVLIEALKITLDKGIDVELKIIGNGPEIENLRVLSEELEIQDKVSFTGDLPYEKALEFYELAHCLVLPSKSEGWPKVIAEAMCFGLICIGARLGQIPAMLEGRGIILNEISPQSVSQALLDIVQHPDIYQQKAIEGSLWSRQFSLDGLQKALAHLLSKHWQSSIDFKDNS